MKVEANEKGSYGPGKIQTCQGCHWYETKFGDEFIAHYCRAVSIDDNKWHYDGLSLEKSMKIDDLRQTEICLKPSWCPCTMIPTTEEQVEFAEKLPQQEKPEELAPMRFVSEVSGLKYDNPNAAGDISQIHFRGRIYGSIKPNINLIKEQNTRIDTLTEKIAKQDQEINNLKAQIAIKDEKINEYKNKEKEILNAITPNSDDIQYLLQWIELRTSKNMTQGGERLRLRNGCKCICIIFNQLKMAIDGILRYGRHDDGEYNNTICDSHQNGPGTCNCGLDELISFLPKVTPTTTSDQKGCSGDRVEGCGVEDV